MEKYISELLFEHDCVIVPAFGGFVARSSFSYFAKTGNALFPPSKSIVFNKNLANNDGLLAGYIMQKEGATYQQANTIIENFVSTCRHLLETQKRFEISGLGVLYRNNENTILFEQDVRINYNPNAFGLPLVSAIKLVKEEKVVEVKPNLQYRQITPVQKPKTVRRIVFAATGAVLIVGLILFTSKQNIFESAKASLNPFWANSKATVLNSKLKVVPDTVAINATLKTLPDSSGIDKTSVVKPVKIAEEWYKQPYQIVVGCFAVKQNAYRLINQLEGQSLTANIAGQNAKNLYVVSVAGYEDEKAARKKLSEMKRQYPAAWLYKR